MLDLLHLQSKHCTNINSLTIAVMLQLGKHCTFTFQLHLSFCSWEKQNTNKPYIMPSIASPKCFHYFWMKGLDSVHPHAITMDFRLDVLQVHLEQGTEDFMQLHPRSSLPSRVGTSDSCKVDLWHYHPPTLLSNVKSEGFLVFWLMTHQVHEVLPPCTYKP